MSQRGAPRSAGIDRRRGVVGVALAALASVGAAYAAGCGEQLELADNPAAPAPGSGSDDAASPRPGDGAPADGAIEGGEARRCRARPLEFARPKPLTVTVEPGLASGASLESPFVGHDELLFFGESAAGGARTLVAGERVATTEDFKLHALDLSFPDDELAPAGSDSDEIFFGHPSAKRIYRTVRDTDGTWQPATYVPEIVPPADAIDRWPSLTSSGGLLFCRTQGPQTTLLEATRASKDAAFEPPRQVSSDSPPPGMTLPSITPDGDGLLYTIEGTGPRFVPRSDRGFAFAEATPIVIDPTDTGGPIRVRSISPDGCRLYVTMTIPGGGVRVGIAERR